MHFDLVVKRDEKKDPEKTRRGGADSIADARRMRLE
jgi:hypothetical protein